MANLTLMLRKVAGKLFDTTDALFSHSYEQINKEINSFPEPKDDFERAFFQYKCTMKRSKWYVRCCVQLSALCVLPIYLYKMKKNSKKAYETTEKDAVFFSDRTSMDIVPASLREKYPNTVVENYGGGMLLNKRASAFIKQNIIKRTKNPYFILKVIMKFGMAEYAIVKYNPKAIISYSETSFVTSLITQYCEQNGIQNIFVMHGERLYGLKFAFFRSSEYYAWDEDYLELFKEMRCDLGHGVVEVPDAVRLHDYNCTAEKKYDYTFYMQDETTASMERYREIIEQLVKEGYGVSVRPHPLYRDIILESLKGVDVNIQISSELSLGESFSATKAVVSKFSTVLYQAWHVGIDIVIDDITMRDTYLALKDLKYVMLNKPHRVLSEVVK